MADIQPGRYRHFKGNEYQVLGIARHSETLEELVVYRGPLRRRRPVGAPCVHVDGDRGAGRLSRPPIHLGGRAMTDYRVVRSRRRTVALQVDQTGSVVVRAPMTLPAEEIRTFVEKHETWIHRQQQRQARYRAEHRSPPPRSRRPFARQAKAHLPQRVAYWAGVMGVRPTGIRITSARTRFGSCSGKTVSASPCT